MRRSILPFGCFGLIIFGLILLMPFFFANILLSALDKLGLSPLAAVLVAGGMFIGGLLNIPLYRVKRKTPIEVASPTLFGFRRLTLPQLRETSTVVAINLGGAVIPMLLVLYEIARISQAAPGALPMMVIAVLANVGVCYWLARPVPGVGIALNPFIPAILAVLSAWALTPVMAPAVAFTAGVLGPVIGADLLHLPQMEEIPARMMSIGGAGTFDGIVLSGLAATLLA